MLRATRHALVPRAGLWALLYAAATALGCGHSRSASAPRPAAQTNWVAPQPPAPAAVDPPSAGAQLDGHLFPEHVLAMTWDDGPDKHTVELARYLASQHVSGTFFVVQSWRQDISAYPGSGSGKFDTGYSSLPVLQDLVSLRQRIGNHTLNHVLLAEAEPELALAELTENQRAIDPFLGNEQRFLRAPCGSWSSSVARLTGADPYLRQLIGPIRWDIDRKDWESSTECNSSARARDCERFAGGGLRLTPRATARRYLDAIEDAGRGIVLLHDRVADVGSKYALEVARALLPPLIAKGYVFVAPVLGFSPPVERASALAQAALVERPLSELRLADADGDGRADLCGRRSEQLVCLHAEQAPASGAGEMPRASFGEPEPRLSRPDWPAAELADVNGDGEPDRCWGDATGVRCALARGTAFDEATLWLAGAATPPLLGDINGDGRADVCLRASGSVSCAFSTGSSFTTAMPWWGLTSFRDDAWLGLGDINGDGRADLCAVADGHVACGLAP